MVVVRGGGGRRHPDHQGAARRADGQPHRVDRRHHQRHDQLHPLGDARQAGSTSRPRSKEAQRLGYAEADPTFDIEGVDAAHKATIMSAIAFGVPVQFDKAYVEGISKLAGGRHHATPSSSATASSCSASRAPHRRKGIELRVHPTLVPAKRLIANVEGAMNAVVVQGDAVGTTLYYGKGAGAEPTASAVVADLVDIDAPAHRRPRPPRAAPRVPAGQRCRTRRSCRSTRSSPRSTCACRWPTRPACWPTSPASWPTHDISIDALLQQESEQVDANGKGETDIILSRTTPSRAR